ncbi:MAG: hypothetical protein WC877_01965 [Dehalococcoidales bacterium]|jgi:hypothetical protein
MGMYTEIIFGCSLKKDTPLNVINVMQFMTDPSDFKDESKITGGLPDHKFFNTPRWKWMFHCSSYYFGVNESSSKMWYDDISKDYRISVRSNLKNYDDEIELFLEWIHPYVNHGTGYNNLYAIVTYEESEVPTLYYKPYAEDKEDEVV